MQTEENKPVLPNPAPATAPVSTPTLAQFANRIAGRGVSGLSRSDGTDVVFMRDWYNTLNMTQKTAIVMAEQVIAADDRPPEVTALRNRMLTKIAEISKQLYIGALTQRPEYAHALRNLLEEAKVSPLMQETISLYAGCFLAAVWSMPLLLPQFGKAIPDSPTDAVQQHHVFLTAIEQLPDDQRRALTTAIQNLGIFQSTLDTAAIRKTLPEDVKKMFEQPEKKEN